jgi:hypothetical protein
VYELNVGEPDVITPSESTETLEVRVTDVAIEVNVPTLVVHGGVGRESL